MIPPVPRAGTLALGRVARQRDENSRGKAESRARGFGRRIVHERGLFVLVPRQRRQGAAKNDEAPAISRSPGPLGIDQVAAGPASSVPDSCLRNSWQRAARSESSFITCSKKLAMSS